MTDETELRKAIAYLQDLDAELEERSAVRGLRATSVAREDMLYQLDRAGTLLAALERRTPNISCISYHDAREALVDVHKARTWCHLVEARIRASAAARLRWPRARMNARRVGMKLQRTTDTQRAACFPHAAEGSMGLTIHVLPNLRRLCEGTPDVTDASKRQLANLKEAHNLLKAAGIPHWLAGGWAIDFLVGRVTRQHSDVDFAIWKDDWQRVEAVLLAQEFAPKTNKFPDETGRLVHKGTHFEFYLLEKNTAGDILVGGRWTDWPLPDKCWSAIGCLQGLHVPVMSPKNLLDGKQRWPDQEQGSPLREKDRLDIDILRSYLAREM